jgi:hypothetical protein
LAEAIGAAMASAAAATRAARLVRAMLIMVWFLPRGWKIM